MMARNRNITETETVGDAGETNAADATTEPTLDGMPDAQTGQDGAEVASTERATVPKHLRPLFNEIGRLSGILALARRAVYDDAPDKAVKALSVLEGQVTAAREIAEISAG